ncbi:hypothetical protein DPEC_G00076510 [Dallia pectoralis]|uniref:Uncharacterized protein n=1 Tax=Dallia pectoralis TaxID=75939 RepID=A0ACC2H3V3_DALPE|nr:hypothetical protein DPEC_G00076510 [Dallia pectoralis]
MISGPLEKARGTSEPGVHSTLSATDCGSEQPVSQLTLPCSSQGCEQVSRPGATPTLLLLEHVFELPTTTVTAPERSPILPLRVTVAGDGAMEPDRSLALVSTMAEDGGLLEGDAVVRVSLRSPEMLLSFTSLPNPFCPSDGAVCVVGAKEGLTGALRVVVTEGNAPCLHPGTHLEAQCHPAPFSLIAPRVF